MKAKSSASKDCMQCKIRFVKPPHLSYKQWEDRKLCSKQCAVVSFETNYTHSKETREKMRLLHLGKPAPWKRGALNYFWRGGKTPQILAERMSLKYKNWRREVFERDDWTCQKCGVRGGKLNADHIKSFTHFPEIRYDLGNGRTLCVPCHIKTPTFGGGSRV